MYSDQEAVSFLQEKGVNIPEVVLILGSGWNRVMEVAQVSERFSYQEVFGVTARVPGHEGELLLASMSGKRVAVLSGRFHMYEGYSAREATIPIRVLAQLGAKKLITTAASGAINEKFKVGDFVILSDLLTLFLALDSPLVGPEFVDMSNVFSQPLRMTAYESARAAGIIPREGVYAYYHGPQFETPADKMAYKILGADVVGMSTVPEAIMAKAFGWDILSLALVTNLAFVKHDHREVLAESEKASQKMSELLQGIVSRID